MGIMYDIITLYESMKGESVMDIMFVLKLVFLVLLCLPFVYIVITLLSKAFDDIMSSMRK